MIWLLYILGMPLAWDRANIDNNWAKTIVALLWPIIPITMFGYWLIVGKQDLTVD